MLKFHIVILFIFTLLNSTYSQQNITATDLIEKAENTKDDIGKSLIEIIRNKNEHVESKEWDHFLKLSEKKIKNTDSKYYSELCFWIGRDFQNKSDFKTAYYYLYKTLQEIKKIETETPSYLSKFHETMGISYYYFRRYNNAEIHLKKALELPNTTDREKISIYNTLGLIYRDQQNLKKSEVYTQRAYKIALKINDEPWTGVLSGNLGYIALQKKDYKKALKLVTRDYNISKKTKETGSELNALALLIEIDLINNDLSNAKSKLLLLTKQIESITDHSMLRAYNNILTRYKETIGDYKGALTSYKLASAYNDSINASRNLLLVANTEFQIDFENKQAENKILLERRKKDNYRIYGLLFLSIIIIGSSIMIIRQIQKRRKKDKEILVLQKLRIEEELKNTEKEMRFILSKTMEKNDLIEHLKQEIENIHNQQDDKSEEDKEKLLDNLQSFTLLTEEDWIDFKKLFEKLNPGFFKYIQLNFPDVTTAEIRLATLIKLNLSTSEMAKSLAISPDSVRKTNLRLRKKLNIDSGDELLRFIHSFNSPLTSHN